MEKSTLTQVLLKEIKQLDDIILESLEYADKRNGFMVGRQRRFVMKMQKESYQRLLKDINNAEQ